MVSFSDHHIALMIGGGGLIDPLVDLSQEIFLEFFQVVLVDGMVINRIKSEKRGLCENVFEIGKLLLKKSILC